MKKLVCLFFAVQILVGLMMIPVMAANDGPAGQMPLEETINAGNENSVRSMKAIAAGIAVAVAAGAGAVSMGLATMKSAEAIARQPEAEGKIRTGTMLGLVFIETAIIYALIVAILIIFVL